MYIVVQNIIETLCAIDRNGWITLFLVKIYIFICIIFYFKALCDALAGRRQYTGLSQKCHIQPFLMDVITLEFNWEPILVKIKLHFKGGRKVS